LDARPNFRQRSGSQVDYRYVFVEKGAMFFALPFKDEEGSSCLFQRLPVENEESG
jgi:hypothetical protein